jgi:hypothetical protein
MNIDHRNPRLRRGFAFVALAAVLGLSAVGLTQCRLVDDSVTGVDLKSNSSAFCSHRSSCIHKCQELYKQCKKAEEALHKTKNRACDKLHNWYDRWACRKAEDRRHCDALKACSRAYQLCQKACRYREGAGSAGR